MSHDSKQELENVRELLSHNSEMLKPFFGVMFWELAEAERQLSAEEFAQTGVNLKLEDHDDEILASFFTSFINIWQSANDFNAASRFIASCLGMSADELLQTRQMYLESLQDG